jgi:hypothetical protein
MPKDEAYIVDLCDAVLGRKAQRQHRFEFLTGDTGRTLPVDAYYFDLKLVIEYLERQHSEGVAFWDEKATASGIPRGKQRALYDQRRRETLPRYGISIIELACSDFECNGSKRLLRNRSNDLAVIQKKLVVFV